VENLQMMAIGAVVSYIVVFFIALSRIKTTSRPAPIVASLLMLGTIGGAIALPMVVSNAMLAGFGEIAFVFGGLSVAGPLFSQRSADGMPLANA
jgi:hypothetical protein